MIAARDLMVKGHSSANQGIDTETLTVYLAFFACCVLVIQCFEDVGLSTLPTLSVAFYLLAMVLLLLKVQRSRNVRGISARSLQMQAMVHGLRLCSTTWLKGYIPSDPTGDWLYQAADVVTLVLCLQLLYTVTKKRALSYQADLDTFDHVTASITCFLIAVIVHPDLNDRVVFDTIWATSLYIDTVAMMPQLWLMSKGGSVEALTGHYVAAITASRACNFAFWIFGFVELAPADGGYNIAGWTVMGAHAIQVVLMCDFMYFYILKLMRSCADCVGDAARAKCGPKSATPEEVKEPLEPVTPPSETNDGEKQREKPETEASNNDLVAEV